jgi:hypothetical protein
MNDADAPESQGVDIPPDVVVYIVDAAASGVIGTFAVKAVGRVIRAFPRDRRYLPRELTGEAAAAAASLALRHAWPTERIPEDLRATSVRVGATGWRAVFEHEGYQYVVSSSGWDKFGAPVVEVDRLRVRPRP